MDTSAAQVLTHASSNTYIYKPLDPLKNEIRLLTLFPGNEEANVKCELSHHRLQKNLTYEALSYTWGENTKPCTIDLHGVPFQVTVNLDVALRNIRRPAGLSPRRLWIDAICINQMDLEERGHQVQCMQQIFSYATRVLAWIGEGSTCTSKAMLFLEQVSLGGGLFDEYGITKTPADTWAALRALFALPYWRRMWIIQELASAIVMGRETTWPPEYRVDVGCGQAWLPLDKVHNAWIYLSRYVDHPYVRGRGEYLAVSNLFSIFSDYGLRCLRSSTLVGLVVTANATDPRDKFYGIYGIIPWRDRVAFLPDYEATLHTACTKIIKHIIEGENNLEILAFDRSVFEPSIPSWAPNIISPALSDTMWRPFWKNFAASRAIAQPSHHRLDICFSTNPSLLTLNGIAVDYIYSVVGPFVNVEAEFDESGEGIHVWDAQNFRKIEEVAFEAYKTAGLIDSDFEGFKKSFKDAKRRMGRLRGPNCLNADPGKDLRVDLLDTLVLGHHVQEFPPLAKPFCNVNRQFLMGYESLKRGQGYVPRELYVTLQHTLQNRCFFATKGGLIGLGPCRTQPNDILAVIFGANMPLILRKDGDYHQLLGEAYVRGKMNGECLNEELETTVFKLI
jgi:hypothetical protein